MATSSSSSLWMPDQGRHKVDIGSSLARALKARKLKAFPGATPTTKRSHLPERDFYSFRFNFKPPSIDTTKPATIDIKKGVDNTSVTAEYPSLQSGEAHAFAGAEQPAKEVDCVLIYDEETGTYTLEKLDSLVRLQYDRKKVVSPRPASPAIAVASSSRQPFKAKDDELQRQLLSMDEDAEGEADDDVPNADATIAYEEEEEEIFIPPRAASPVPPKRQPQPAPPPPKARPIKPIPKTREPKPPVPPAPQPARPNPPPVAPAVAPAPTPQPSKPRPVPKKKAKPTLGPPPPTSTFADEEDLQFGQPAKRPRTTAPPRQPSPPPAPVSVGLSLPGGSNSYAPPPPLPSSHKSVATSSRSVPAPVQHAPPSAPSPALVLQSESDEEDWDEVPTAADIPPSDNNTNNDAYERALEEDIFGDGFADGDDGEDIDANAFEQELIEQMEESDDDFLAAAVSPEPETQQHRQPISLNRLASGGGGADVSEDEYSSSEESDED